MPHIRKAWLICDVCEKQIEIDPTLERPFCSTVAMRERNYKDWGLVEETQILCPDCLEAYSEEKAKADEHLKKFAGVKTINVKV